MIIGFDSAGQPVYSDDTRPAREQEMVWKRCGSFTVEPYAIFNGCDLCDSLHVHFKCPACGEDYTEYWDPGDEPIEETCRCGVMLLVPAEFAIGG